jgi:hypothetical protein
VSEVTHSEKEAPGGMRMFQRRDGLRLLAVWRKQGLGLCPRIHWWQGGWTEEFESPDILFSRERCRSFSLICSKHSKSLSGSVKESQPSQNLLLSLHFFWSASRRSGKEAFCDTGLGMWNFIRVVWMQGRLKAGEGCRETP